MNIAFIIFEGLTVLDFVGMYDPVTRLRTMGFMPDLHWEICAPTELVQDYGGLRLMPTQVGRPLSDYDMILVAGGFSTRTLMHETGMIDWLKTAQPCRWKVSVCTGALLLGAAGFLIGKRATTHPNAYDLLRPMCAQVLDARVVDEGDVITARGVTSAISLGLYLCGKLAGRDVREKIRKQMDYPYED